MNQTTITIPKITDLPKNEKDAAQFIWENQDRLNAASHPEGIGTIEMGIQYTQGRLLDILFDYHMALSSEIQELQNNFFWKHWSKESKEGKRFQLINPDQTAGEGTSQNVIVEVTDIIFFTVSILQILGCPEETWIKNWGNKEKWEDVTKDHLGSPANKRDVHRLLNNALNLATEVGRKQFHAPGFVNCARIITTLMHVCANAGLGWERALDCYAQKLVSNYQRQMRGRSQVGDPLAEKENERIS
jgi:hypothetical protein